MAIRSFYKCTITLLLIFSPSVPLSAQTPATTPAPTPLPSFYEFRTTLGEPQLLIRDFNGEVSLIPGPANTVRIEEALSRPLINLKISQKGEHITVRGIASSKPQQNPSPKRKMELSQPTGSFPEPKPDWTPSLRIKVPQGSSLRANDFSVLKSNVGLTQIRLDSDDCTSAAFADGGSLELNISGRCSVTTGDIHDADIKLKQGARISIGGFTGGKLTAKLENASTLAARGQFSEMVLNSADNTRISTAGFVQERYKASARDTSIISHRGTISGKISRKISQTAQINLASGKP